MARRRDVVWGKALLVLAGALLCLVCVVLMRGDLVGQGPDQDAESTPSSESAVAHEPQGEVEEDAPPADGIQLPEGMEELAELVDSGQISTHEQEGDIAEVSAAVLASYRDQGDCVLASSGYLDLYGSVWACVVRGGWWADVCIVSACEEQTRCQVMVLRMDRDEVARLLEQDGTEEGELS